jgi:hypothetical protein
MGKLEKNSTDNHKVSEQVHGEGTMRTHILSGLRDFKMKGKMLHTTIDPDNHTNSRTETNVAK